MTEHEEFIARARALDVTADALARARAERDRAVCDAVAFGMSAREVGRLVGLSHVGVAKIVRRLEPDDTCVLCDAGEAHEH